jgi:hypothetical protein
MVIVLVQFLVLRKIFHLTKIEKNFGTKKLSPPHEEMYRRNVSLPHHSYFPFSSITSFSHPFHIPYHIALKFYFTLFQQYREYSAIKIRGVCQDSLGWSKESSCVHLYT